MVQLSTLVPFCVALLSPHVLGFNPISALSRTLVTKVTVTKFIELLNDCKIPYWQDNSRPGHNDIQMVQASKEKAKNIVEILSERRHKPEYYGYFPGTSFVPSKVRFQLPATSSVKEFFEFVFRDINFLYTGLDSNSKDNIRYRETATFIAEYFKVERRNITVSINDLELLLKSIIISSSFRNLNQLLKKVREGLEILINMHLEDLKVFFPIDESAGGIVVISKEANNSSFTFKLNTLTQTSENATEHKFSKLFRELLVKYQLDCIDKQIDFPSFDSNESLLKNCIQMNKKNIFITFENIPTSNSSLTDSDVLKEFLASSIEKNFSFSNFQFIKNDFFKSCHAANLIPSRNLKYFIIDKDELQTLISSILDTIRIAFFTLEDFSRPDNSDKIGYFTPQEKDEETFLRFEEIFLFSIYQFNGTELFQKYTAFVASQITQLEERKKMLQRLFRIMWDKSTFGEFLMSSLTKESKQSFSISQQSNTSVGNIPQPKNTNSTALPQSNRRVIFDPDEEIDTIPKPSDNSADSGVTRDSNELNGNSLSESHHTSIDSVFINDLNSDNLPKDNATLEKLPANQITKLRCDDKLALLIKASRDYNAKEQSNHQNAVEAKKTEYSQAELKESSIDASKMNLLEGSDRDFNMENQISKDLTKSEESNENENSREPKKSIKSKESEKSKENQKSSLHSNSTNSPKKNKKKKNLFARFRKFLCF